MIAYCNKSQKGWLFIKIEFETRWSSTSRSEQLRKKEDFNAYFFKIIT